MNPLRLQIKILLNTLIFGAIAVGLVLATAGTLVTAALFTETGTRMLLQNGAEWYSKMIPGEIQADGISGTLAWGLELNHLSVRDRSQPLIEIERVTLAADLFALASSQLSIPKINIVNATVTLPSDNGTGGFRDLALPSLPSKDLAAPSEAAPFSLPVAIAGEITIKGFTLLLTDGDGNTGTPLTLSHLNAQVDARPHDAALHLKIAEGNVSALGDGNGRLSFDAEWTGTTLWVTALRFAHPAGRLDVPFLSFNWDTLEGAVEAVGAIRSDVIAALTKLKPTAAAPAFFLKAEGKPSSVSALLRIASGATDSLTAQVSGQVYPNPDFKTFFDVKSDIPLPEQGLENRMNGKGSLMVRGNDYPHASMSLSFLCSKCSLDPLGPVDLDMTGELNTGNGTMDVAVGALGAALKTSVTLQNWQPVLAIMEGNVSNIAGLLAPIQSKSLRGIDGRFGFSGTCSGVQKQFRCETNLQAGAIRTPFGSVAKLSASGGISPLDEKIPFTGTITAGNIRFKGTRLGEVRVEAEGDTGEIRAEIVSRLAKKERLRAAVSAAFGPILKVRIASLKADYRALTLHLRTPADVSITDEQIDIAPLYLKIAEGDLTLAGVVSTKGASQFSARINHLNLNNIALLLPSQAVNGMLNAQFSLSGTPEAFISRLRMDTRALTINETKWGNLKLDADYRPGQVSAQLQAEGGPAKSLALSGSFGADANWASGTAVMRPDPIYLEAAVASLDIGRLRTLLPALKTTGIVDINVRVTGTLARPNINVSGQANTLAWRTVSLGDTGFSASYADEIARASIDVRGGVAKRIHLNAALPMHLSRTGFVWHSNAPHRLSLTLEKGRLGVFNEIQSARGSKSAASPPVSGTIEFSMELSGIPADPVLDLFLETDALSWKTKPFATAMLRLVIKKRIADLHAQLLSDANRFADLKVRAPFVIQENPIGVGPNPEGHHFLDFSFAGFQSEWVAMAAPLPPAVAFQVSGQVAGEGKWGDFNLKGEVHGDAAFDKAGPFRLRGSIDADQVNQSASLSIGPKTAPFVNLSLATQLPARFNPDQATLLAALPLDGRLEVPKLDLSLFTRYLPDVLHKLEGILDGAVTIKGTAADPAVDGTLHLSDAAVTVAPLHQRIKDAAMTLSMTHRRARIRDFHFRSGGGTAAGTFDVSIEKDSILGQGGISFKKFPLVRPGLPEGLVNGQLTALFQGQSDSTTLRLTLNKGYVHLMNTGGGTTPKAIREGERIQFSSVADHAVPAEEPSISAAHPFRLILDITDPVEIRGQGVEMIWGGNLAVTTDAEGTRVSGGIDAKPGRLRMIGNLFEIQSGLVTFPASGEIDPFVNMVATVRTPEALVTASVNGRAAKPDLKLTSAPPMSQYQILTLLITGKSDNAEESDSETDIPSQAASLLMSFNNPELERQLYEKLGVDRIALSMGSTMAEPIMVVGKRIGRRVYVESEYHHNAPDDENRASGRIEYRVAPGWSLETEYGDAQKGEVGVYWQKRFGDEGKIKSR